jgi:hypothetical protein
MSAFRVQFLKHIYDHRGFDHLTCQATFQIDARHLDDALKDAQKMFCSERKIPKWYFHADEFRIEPVAGPRRTKGHRRLERGGARNGL